MAASADALFADTIKIPKPSGYSDPTTAISQTDPEVIGENTYSMTASDGVSTTAAGGLNALVSAFETWLTGTWIPTTLGMDVTNTITCIATIQSITVGTDPGDIYLNDSNRTFVITFTATIEVT